MGTLNKAGVNMVATILSLVLWFVYIYLSTLLISVLRRRKIQLFSFPVVVTTFIFVCNLGQTVCTIYTAQHAYIRYRAGPIAYFTLYEAGSIDRGWYAANNFWQCAVGRAIDFLMLWRLYAVWSRNMRVMYLPITFTCFGIIECMITIAGDLMVQHRFNDPKFVTFYNIPTIAMLFNDILLTWYFTGMICYRIWSVERQRRVIRALHGEIGLENQMESPYVLITQVLIQSGMLYSITEAVFLSCILAGVNDGRDILNALNVRVMGVATVLILLQLNRTKKRDTPDNQATLTGPTIPMFLVSGMSNSCTTEVGLREALRTDHLANEGMSDIPCLITDPYGTLPC